MEVILLEKIRNLGNLGDLVHVKPGFARNFLLPYGKAVSATKENTQKFEARRAELEKAAAEKLAQAQARAEAIGALGSVTISARVGEQDKLYGSIGAREIADAVSARDVEVAKHEVLLPEGPIHHTGEFDIKLQLHSDVVAVVKLVVVGEE